MGTKVRIDTDVIVAFEKVCAALQALPNARARQRVVDAACILLDLQVPGDTSVASIDNRDE